MREDTSFSFYEIINAPNIILGEPNFIESIDGIKLAYYEYSTSNNPIASLIFIHGGGAYSGAGYQYLANGLSTNYNVLVYLVDLRGHGNSESPRGDSPNIEQVWKDIKVFIDFVKEKNTGLPLYLGGHSSGGDLILNYLFWNKKSTIDGYIFISPEFGYKSETVRKDVKSPFAKVDSEIFMQYWMSQGKQFGNSKAVYFNYPDKIIKSHPLFLKAITCNMSISLTPNNPQEQFRNIDKPFAIFIGEKDELLDPEKVISYANFSKEEIRMKSKNQIIKNKNHLSILLVADNLIGDTILTWQSTL